MQPVEASLKAEILNAIRAVEAAKTLAEARKIGQIYGSVVRRTHAAGYEISSIRFDDTREPVDVQLKLLDRQGTRRACAV